MDEKMLLQAIQQIVKTEIEPLNGRMDRMESHIDEMSGRIDKMEGRIDEMGGRIDEMGRRIDEMSGRIDEMGNRIDEMGGRIDRIETRMDRMEMRMDRVEVLLEHDIPNHLQLLAEGHQGIVARLPREHELEELHSRVSTLERVSADHSEEIRTLKCANGM